MIKYFNTNQKNYLKKLEIILNKRSAKQKVKSSKVRSILQNVKNQGDKAVIRYEKKYSKVKYNSKKIKFSKNEINRIIKNIDKITLSNIKIPIIIHNQSLFSFF